MSYPLEKDKGKAFGVFWAIFQFGSFIGSIIALAINVRSGALSAVSTATYLVTLIVIDFRSVSSSPVLGIHRHYVLRHGINATHSASQRDCTLGWHARKGPSILVCARRAS